MAENGAWVAGARVVIDFGEDGAALLDGVTQAVHRVEPGEPADTHIAVSWTDWQALMTGSLDPRRAINNGKIAISGDMHNVAKLIELGHRLF
jgi:putative sterol carrier protein